MSFVWVVSLYALWSSVFSLGKMALEVSPPIFLTAARMLLGGTVLLGALLLCNRAALRISLKQFLSLSVLGVFSIYLANIAEFWGLQHLSAAKACFIYSLGPFFSILFSYLHFGERMNGRKWLGMMIGFLGILPILAVQTGSEELVGGIAFFSWPELSLAAAAISAVYGWVLLRLLVKDSAVSPVMASGTSMMIGGGLALVHSLLVETWSPLPVESVNITPFLQGILLMTLVSNVICYNLYGFMLKRFTATFLSFVGLLSPIFASLSGWMFLGEEPNPIIFLGTAITSLGLWLIYSAELRQGYIASTSKVSA